MTILENNLIRLPILKDVYAGNEKHLYDIEYNAKNQITLKINNNYMHSKYDVEKETDRIVDMLMEDKNSIDVLILYGSGLGYVLRRCYDILIKSSSLKIKPYIMLIENDIKMFLTSLKYFDYSEILQSENVKIFLEAEKEVIGSFLQTIPTKYIRYHHHRPSYYLNSDYYKATQNYINFVLDRKDMNSATFKRFQTLWTRNSIRNAPYFLKSSKLKDLNNIASGLTSAIIAGGPNLNRSINFLFNNQNNMIIIAVDTSYKFLIKNGIKVDIIVTVDPQYWNYKFLEGINITNEIIVTDSSIYYKIFNIAETNRFFIGNSIFPLNQYFDEGEDRGTLAAGGSVATTAFDVARIIGSKEIVLIGLDLSYPNRETHFKGAFFEQSFLSTSNFINTAEKMVYKYLTHVPLIKISSTNGKVYSDQKMALFKKWFDREISLTSAKVILPDLGGAYIEGSNIIPIEKIKIINSSKDSFQKKISALLEKNNYNNGGDIINKSYVFIKCALELKKSYDKIIKLITDDGFVNQSDIITIQKIEKEISNDRQKSLISGIISSSAQDILIMIMENYQYDNDEKRSAWIKTKLLYKALTDLIDFYLKYFNKLLKIME
ncbi:MAG: motility associated factor glycosyltransferase family protein [Spirochaetes bacterium]|nr:motility associated factor glycosyltransferase family protein [Spirochaetota bacterium]